MKLRGNKDRMSMTRVVNILVPFNNLFELTGESGGENDATHWIATLEWGEGC